MKVVEAEREATRYGVDIALLEDNLKLTYEERLEQHQSALELVEALVVIGYVRSRSSRSR